MATVEPAVASRTTVVTVTGVLTLLLGAAYALFGGQLILAGASWTEQARGDPWGPVATLFGLGPALAIALGVAFLPLGLLGLAAGWGLLRRRRWGRALALVLATLAFLLGLLWVGGADGDATEMCLGACQILYGVFTAAILIRNRAEFCHSTQPAS